MCNVQDDFTEEDHKIFNFLNVQQNEINDQSFFELGDRTHMLQEFIETSITHHPVVKENKDYRILIDNAQISLSKLYKIVMGEYFDRTEKTENNNEF